MIDKEIKNNMTDNELWFIAINLLIIGFKFFKKLMKVENLEERIETLQQEIQTSELTK